MKILYTLLVLLNIQTFAANTPSFETLISPDYLKDLNLSKAPNVDEITKRLGKPALVEKENHYFSLRGLKYPFSYELKNKRIRSIYYRTLESKITYQEIAKSIVDLPKPQKVKHNYYSILVKPKNLTLTFSTVDNTLYSVKRVYP